MAQPLQQMRVYSQLLDEDVDLGLPSTDVDALLGLGDMMADRPALIVHMEPVSRLRKWADDED